MTTKAKTAKKASAKRTTKKAKATKGTQPPASGAENGRKLSAIDAAAKVLGEAKKPMNAKEMIERMENRGLWKSPGGKTPHATLYSAILREIGKKGKDARFKKVERGQFAHA